MRRLDAASSEPYRRGGVMMQIGALLLDAYRQLNSARLFWVTMLISTLIVVVFFLLGITEQGVTFAGWRILPFITTENFPPATFYKLLFTNLAIDWWLTLGAVILALISTASVFPELMSGGAIDLYLSKPLSRWTLFLTKFLSSLLFVALQVTVFCAAVFLLIGIRGGAWEPGVFLAVPLVVLFFSYIYAFAALLGVLTRSTLAAILLTVLIWFALFLVGTAESVTRLFAVAAEVRVERVEQFRDRYEQRLDRERALPESQRNAGTISEAEFFLADSQDTLQQARDDLALNRLLHNIAFGLYTVVPKTGETTALIKRWLIDVAELRDERFAEMEEEPEEEVPGLFDLVEDPEVFRRMQETAVTRSPAYILGTSLAAEAVLVLLAGWLFVRRDY